MLSALLPTLMHNILLTGFHPSLTRKGIGYRAAKRHSYSYIAHFTNMRQQIKNQIEIKIKKLTIRSSNPFTHIPGGNDDRRSLISFLTVRKKFCGSVGWNMVSLNLWLFGAESIIENPENKYNAAKTILNISHNNVKLPI